MLSKCIITVIIFVDKYLPKLKLKIITTEDMQNALKSTKPSAVHLAARYQKWQGAFGST
jgi:hypothetical protein